MAVRLRMLVRFTSWACLPIQLLWLVVLRPVGRIAEPRLEFDPLIEKLALLVSI